MLGVSVQSFMVCLAVCRVCVTMHHLQVRNQSLILLRKNLPEKWRTNTTLSGAFMKKVLIVFNLSVNFY